MKIIFMAVLCLIGSAQANAADLLKGRAINKTCALCHGAMGQGTESAESPRIAGLTRGFMIKILKQFRDGTRKNEAMVMTAGIDKMSDGDIDDIASFLASVNLRDDPRFDIDKAEGDGPEGKKIFMTECKNCHRKTGYGKPKKGVPPLAGQQTEYILAAIGKFKDRRRVHDDDPEDDLFDEFEDEDLKNLIAFLSGLDDVREARVATLPGVSAVTAEQKVEAPGMNVSDIVQTVAKIQLGSEVSREDAIEAMRSKATELNMRLVGEQHVSKALEKRGEKTSYLAIFQFCNLSDARAIVANNPLYAAYMPCRVAMVEDKEGKTWLMMLNLDILIDNKLVSREIVKTVIGVNQKMLEIMVAGVTGDF